MVATLFVGGLLSFTARTFASITESLVDFKALRGVQKKAKSGDEPRVMQPTLVLTDRELDELATNNTFAAGLVRGAAFMRNGGLGATS